jgi:hypothetical protein
MSPRHLYGSKRGMGPPPLEYPPQVLEIDPSSSRTLPSPSASTSNAWDSPAFSSHAFGDLSTYGPSSAARQVSVESHSRGTAPNPLLHWYIDNDGPWIPKSSISELPEESHPTAARQGNRMHLQHGNSHRQRIPSDAATYPYGVPPSDSGYATRRSDGNDSTFSADVPDRDQDACPVADYQQYPGLSEALQQRDPRLSDWAAPHSVSVSDSQSGKPFVCPTCLKGVKTRSELK